MMPTLPALTINSAAANIEEIYDESICDPTADPPDTLEILNGGLDVDNLVDGITIPAWATQPGSFIRAVQIPFDRWEFIYATQLSDDAGDGDMVVVAALSTRVFLPWDCKKVVVSWQALWRHDATTSFNGTSDAAELWTAKFLVGGTEVASIRRMLTATRAVTDAATHLWSSAPVSDEDRWPWSAATVVLSESVYPNQCAKGYQTFMCRIKAKIYGDDPEKAKLVIPTGAITVIAVRG